MIQVYPVGAKVYAYGEHATVVSVCVGANDHVTYNVAYFHNGDRKTMWVEECEVTPSAPERLRIGFLAGGSA